MDEKELRALHQRCTRFLSGHYPLRPQQALSELASWTDATLAADRYGMGELITSFEAQVAALLGKEEALFLPSGTMAQQIALRLWAEARGTPWVGFHPTCHLELHEYDAYRLLHGLRGVLVGPRDGLMQRADLEAVPEPLAVLLLELPQREIGGQLPSWEELVALVEEARRRGSALHLDGARLWECQPFYQRDYAQIAALFDSVYVSFYKGLGGMAGAVLAGSEAFIAAARRWQRRHGGNLVHLFPYVLSAQKGLEERLGRMGLYHAKAVEIATALGALPDVELVPNPPPAHMMHLFLRGDRERLHAALRATIEESRTWLFYPLRATLWPTCHKVELSVGDATLDLPTEEIVRLVEQVLAHAR